MVELEAYFGSFRDGATIADRLIALRQIMAAKKLKEFSQTPEFEAGVDELMKVARLAEDAQIRLAAIDGLVRIWNSSLPSKTVNKIESGLIEVMATELPPLFLISDGSAGLFEKPSESRLNITIALGLSSQPWMHAYRIRSLLSEDRAPKVRLELAKQVLLERVSLEGFLLELARKVSEPKSSWTVNSEVTVRRLRDLVQSIREAQQSVDAEPGEGLGTAIEIFIEALLGSGGPKSLGAEVASLAVEVLLLNLLGIRARLSLMLDPASFKSVRVVCRWWGKVSRPQVVVEALEIFADRLLDAILVLTRMGQRSTELVSTYVAVVGSELEARRRLAEFLKRYPGLQPEIVQWLTTGISVKSSDVQLQNREILGAIEAGSDRTISMLMLDAQSLMDSMDGLGEFDLPQQGSLISTLATRAERLALDVIALGRERGLALRGKGGDDVEFSPNAHEAIGAIPTEPIVRLVSPGVVQIRSGGGEIVVVKGRVVSRPQR